MKKSAVKSKAKPTRPATDLDESRFTPIIKAFSADKKVTLGGRFGSVSLKSDGKVFAMLVKGKLVVKLPKERVAELTATAGAEYFDPGHGRLMKEWVALAGQEEQWIELAREACAFVDASPTRVARKRPRGGK